MQSKTNDTIPSHASKENSRERPHNGRESRTTIRRSRQHRESGTVFYNKRLDNVCSI